MAKAKPAGQLSRKTAPEKKDDTLRQLFEASRYEAKAELFDSFIRSLRPAHARTIMGLSHASTLTTMMTLLGIQYAGGSATVDLVDIMQRMADLLKDKGKGRVSSEHANENLAQAQLRSIQLSNEIKEQLLIREKKRNEAESHQIPASRVLAALKTLDGKVRRFCGQARKFKGEDSISARNTEWHEQFLPFINQFIGDMRKIQPVTDDVEDSEEIAESLDAE